MKIKIGIPVDKVLIYAILFSAVWHLFWLSAFKVVIVPKAAKSVKFSNISFLGTILEKSVLSVNVGPRDSTAAEKGYLAYVSGQWARAVKGIAQDAYASPALDTIPIGDEEAVAALTVAGIGSGKLEPGRDMD